MIDEVRAFNRAYTRTIGVLDEHLFDSEFSLSEMRVLYELAHRDAPTATELGRDLGIDAGYLSRILRRFEARRYVTRTPSPADRRHSLLRLTARGRAAFAPLEARARDQVGGMLSPLSGAERQQLVAAMGTITRLLDREPPPPAVPYLLRPPRPGDLGWVIQRHGELYAREWGYTSEFEALVARICADFLDHCDPAGERCWIAERDGAPIGSVFVVRKSKTVAKLRLLIVDPGARGLGLGARLVDECVRFARDAGYSTLTLWTHRQLDAARRIYRRAGFRCVAAQPTRSFGKTLVDETWELSLAPLRSSARADGRPDRGRTPSTDPPRRGARRRAAAARR
jgi:DNA-binding MarR family transcriptional regulator/GNAT superfamily N-acetyltransferase